MADEVDVNNDDQMLDHYGHTKAELFQMIVNGEDIGGVYDGDPIDLFG